MGYASSTEGSSANVPVLLGQGIASTGMSSTQPSTAPTTSPPRQWNYNSTHTQAEVAAAGFISDARDLGMAIGDSLYVVGSTTMVISHHVVNALTSTGCTVSAGLLVSSAS